MIRLDSSHLAVGKNRQLFFDNMIIERVQNLSRAWHTPQAMPEPVLQADRPWEGVTYFAIGTYKVIRDRDGRWHCWYGQWYWDHELFATTPEWHMNLDVSWQRLAYATSKDGEHWDKPNLGFHQVDGQDTNIILGDKELGTVYIVTPIEDPFEDDAGKRFKTMMVHCGPFGYGIKAAYSGDAVHWTFYDEEPYFGSWGPVLDDELILSCDPYGRMYTATVRSPHMYRGVLTPGSPCGSSFVAPSEPGAWWKFNKRRIWRTESGDLRSWTQPYPILQPDEEDNLDESYYAMCETRIGDLILGFVNVFSECSNTMSVRLVYSRDGKNWEWANKRQPWLESSKMSGKEWDSVMTYLGSPPIEVGDEHWVFYGGAKNHHDWWLTGLQEGLEAPEARDKSLVGYHLGLAKMRLDGFVSLDTPPEREGILVTRPFAPQGKHLVLNAQVEGGGYIDVEITDAAGSVVTGCSRAESDRFIGDSVRHLVTWRGGCAPTFPQACQNGDLLSGYCKLNIFMRKASLYSFQTTDDPEARSSMDESIISRRLRK